MDLTTLAIVLFFFGGVITLWYFFIFKQKCPKDCSNHGECNMGTCTCKTGYTGLDCSVWDCANTCSKFEECVNNACKAKKGLVWTDFPHASWGNEGIFPNTTITGAGVLQQCKDKCINTKNCVGVEEIPDKWCRLLKIPSAPYSHPDTIGHLVSLP